MKISSTFLVWNQVQVVLKLFMWILTSKEKFLSKEFVFDPGRILDLSTLEDGHDSRMNHFEERGNDENTTMTINPSPTRIQELIRNPYPIRIEDPLT